MDTINFVLNVLDICDLIESVESNVESEDSNENEPALSDSNIDVHDRANDNIEVEKSDNDKIEETMTDSLQDNDTNEDIMTAKLDTDYSSDDFDNESPIDSELEDLDVNNDTSNLVVETVINSIIDKAVNYVSNRVPSSNYALGDSSASCTENIGRENLENNMPSEHTDDANKRVDENDIEINILSEAEIQTFLKKIFDNCEYIINSSLCINTTANLQNEKESRNHACNTLENVGNSESVGNQESGEIPIAPLPENDNDTSQDDNSDNIEHNESGTNTDGSEAAGNPPKRTKLMTANLLIEGRNEMIGK